MVPYSSHCNFGLRGIPRASTAQRDNIASNPASVNTKCGTKTIRGDRNRSEKSHHHLRRCLSKIVLPKTIMDTTQHRPVPKESHHDPL